jgi:hypothetical protein
MPPTELHDELPVPHFEDRLWQELSDAHAGRRREATGSLRRRRPGPAHQGRRLLTVGVGSIAAAAMVAAVAIVGSDGGGDTRRDTGDRAATGETASPDVDLAARITTATEQAVADSVVHTFQDVTTGPGDTENWSDEASGAYRWLGLSDEGTPSHDIGVVEPPAIDAVSPPPFPEPPDGCSWAALTPEVADLPDPDCNPPIPPDYPTVLVRMVDYCFEEYVESEQQALPARNEAEFVGEQLADGKLIEDGTEVIDGRELIKLRTPGDYAEHTYYVDPDTYRPVQLHGYPDDAGVPGYVMTFEYLPRTPENLALLVAPLPGGFSQVDALPTDGQRLAAGCDA